MDKYHRKVINRTQKKIEKERQEQARLEQLFGENDTYKPKSAFRQNRDIKTVRFQFA